MFLIADEPASPGLEPSEGSPPPLCRREAYLDVNVVPEQDRDEQQAAVSRLLGRISELKSKQRHLEGRRREALNRILDIKGSIRVFCRVRPNSSSTVTTGSEKVTIRSAGARKTSGWTGSSLPRPLKEVFSEVEPIVRSAIDGHSVCVFAYGQTGTGKTYTMEGTAHQPGIVPCAMKQLFREASSMDDAGSSLTFSMSMLEIYMGSLRDLLGPKVLRQEMTNLKSSTFLLQNRLSSLNIQTGGGGCVEVEGLTEVRVVDFKQASHWYAKGKRARTTSWTSVNEASSRSHWIAVGRPASGGGGAARAAEELVSKLWMVDLGGSERLLKTGAKGQTMDEGKAINLSLSALGDVISALKRRKNHVPYRNSKLTQILKDSLGVGSKVLMLVHISSSEYDIGETICSLLFARRARGVDSGEEASEVVIVSLMILFLRGELRQRKEMCIAELNWEMKDAEEGLQKLRTHLRQAEDQLQEKKKNLLLEGSPPARDGDPKGRQRRSAAGEVNGKARPARIKNLSAVDFSLSQSRSLLEPPSRLSSYGGKSRTAKVEAGGGRFKSLPPLCVQGNLSCNSTDSSDVCNIPAKGVEVVEGRRVGVANFPNSSLIPTICRSYIEDEHHQVDLGKAYQAWPISTPGPRRRQQHAS
ncbi:unnamed protein product [Spirodela intermedia]|uniref:Kinesin motor domain-containing protein n=1 Tax=Spirodela intermedia TaxID=51605 RepID=A0A7I8IB20_SPIIN|nr:unnamed protein product [Spirodela intermedia]CAA6654222.1 unnamed protein product [Spirodela intermedia]